MESAIQQSSADANEESCAPDVPQQAGEARDPAKEEVKTEQEEDAEEGEQVPKLPPKPLTLKEPKQESSSQSPKQSPKRESASSPVKRGVPPLVCISAPPVQEKQPLSLARAAGEKVAVGFKMDEVEAMAVYRSQQGKLLQNVLGGWDPRRKCFRKLKYALVLLSEVEKCGGAPIKHKNWTIIMKRLRTSTSLKTALGGIPSTGVLNATLTAYRYMIDPIKDMLRNLPATAHEKLISAQLEELLKAIRKYCAPYLAMECAAKHVRHAISLSYPRVMHTPSSDPSRLVSVGAKRKHELCGSMAATGAPARKLAYQPPRLLSSSRWPIAPPGVDSMSMPRFIAGLCAPESNVQSVGLSSLCEVRSPRSVRA